MSTTLESFNINDCCEFFDYHDKKQWDKVNKFVVFDADDIGDVLNKADCPDPTDDEYWAFDAGIEHAFECANRVLKNAGVKLRIASTDLGNNMGYVLIKEGDEPEEWTNRVFKKSKADSWK